MKKLVIIVGPTGSGKSALGLKVAQHYSGEIICADSRQIYCDLDIGTAKPTPLEQTSIPHHLFDICSPERNFTVAEYVLLAEQHLADIWQRQHLPILVGGTGLYVKTLLYAYQIPEVPPQLALRLELEAQEQAEGVGFLHRKLQQCDPQTAAKIHPHDLHRMIRALEVFEATGQPISTWQRRSEVPRYDCVYVGLQMDKAILYPRLQQRIAQMIQEGLVAEVQALRSQYGPDLPLLQTLNYREIGQYLDGELTLEQAQEAMFIHTRQYAKRQMTWFRKDPAVHWLTCTGGDEDLPQLMAWLAAEL